MKESNKRSSYTTCVCNHYKSCTMPNCNLRNFEKRVIVSIGFKCTMFRKDIHARFVPITEFQYKMWEKSKGWKPENEY